MFVWDDSTGSYSSPIAAWAAWKSGLIAAGASSPLHVSAIGGDFNTAPNLIGLQSFNIYSNLINAPVIFTRALLLPGPPEAYEARLSSDVFPRCSVGSHEE